MTPKDQLLQEAREEFIKSFGHFIEKPAMTVDDQFSTSVGNEHEDITDNVLDFMDQQINKAIAMTLEHVTPEGTEGEKEITDWDNDAQKTYKEIYNTGYNACRDHVITKGRELL